MSVELCPIILNYALKELVIPSEVFKYCNGATSTVCCMSTQRARLHAESD